MSLVNLSLIEGGKLKDHRGEVSFVNDFSFDGIKRFYQITNSEKEPIRAWQGHKKENKWFFVSKGSFRITVIKIDNWETPSNFKNKESFILDSEKPVILHVPGGYVNRLESLKSGAVLQVFSNFTLEESKSDDIRFSEDFW